MEDIKTEVAEEVVTEETAVAEVELEVEKTPEQLAREAEAEEKARKAKIKEIWDKVTTGLLIFLMASPFLILLYILIWFIST